MQLDIQHFLVGRDRLCIGSSRLAVRGYRVQGSADLGSVVAETFSPFWDS